MVHDRKSLGVYISGPRHGMIHARKYHDRGERMPVAIAIGVDPLILMAAIAEAPVELCEYELAGALRNEPVRLVKCETVNLEVSAVALSALLRNRLEEAGIPGITGLWMDPEALFSNVFISIDQQFYGHAKWVTQALWGLAPFYGKMVVIVDSDVDIYNLKKINSAFAFRFQADRGLGISKGNFGALDPSIDPDVLKKTILAKWDKVLLDATWPFEWQPRKEWGGLKHPPSCLEDEEDIEKVRKRWREYGID